MQPIHEQFRNVLRQEAEEVERLLEALNREHEVLLSRDTDAISAVVAEKEEALGRLNALAGQRKALLKQAGYSDDKAGFSAFLESDSSGTMTELWHSLEEGLRACQQQNQINGMMLESSRQQTEQMLQLLLGHGHKTELYDQRGSSKTSYGKSTSIKV